MANDNHLLSVPCYNGTMLKHDYYNEFFELGQQKINFSHDKRMNDPLFSVPNHIYFSKYAFRLLPIIITQDSERLSFFCGVILSSFLFNWNKKRHLEYLHSKCLITLYFLPKQPPVSKLASDSVSEKNFVLIFYLHEYKC